MTDARLVLIVNADDYGLTPGTNRAVEAAHAAGVVTSTSVMVNQRASEAASELPARHPELGVGIHLTLTLGVPVSGPERVRSLVDREGSFLGRESLLDRLRSGQLVMSEVALECSEQLRRLRSMGVEADHWNMHQHVQEYAPLGQVVARAMTEQGLRVTRNPRRVRSGTTFSLAGFAAIWHDHRRRAGYLAIADSQRMPDGLLDAAPGKWPVVVPALPPGVIEGICHPSDTAEDLSALTPDLTTARVEELRALLDPQLGKALQLPGVSVSSFAGALGR